MTVADPGAAAAAPLDDRVWAPHRRGLAVGLVLTITMLAFEALGVATAMPIVARDLDGVGLYGWAFTAALLGSLVGISVAGGRVDRHGPGTPFLAGLALFAAGLIGAGTAPTMEVLVGARFVQGLGIGVVPAVVYAATGRAFGDRARARVFALLSSAWVVPGLVGPAVSGAVAESIGWQWVFLGVVPLTLVNAALAAPPLFRLGAPPAAAVPPAKRTIARAAVLAAAAAFVVGGLNAATPVSLAVAAVAAAVGVWPLRDLMPAGTFAARPGLPAAVAVRGMVTAAFFCAQSFLPLALTDVRGQRAATAGLLLTTSTVTWTVGAWLQERRGHLWGRRTVVRRGIVLLLAGVTLTPAILSGAVPPWVAAVAWPVAGLGMGMAYSGLSLLVLAQAASGGEGRASAALQLAEMLSVALATGVGGAAIAAAERAGPLRPGLVAAFGLAALAAVAAVAAGRGLPDDRPAPLGAAAA